MFQDYALFPWCTCGATSNSASVMDRRARA
jgi:hypothetical protein